MTDVEIAPSAYRHDIDADQIGHAVRNVISTEDLDEGLTMFIGPDQTGQLLEVGILLDGPTIIHARPARPRFLR